MNFTMAAITFICSNAFQSVTNCNSRMHKFSKSWLNSSRKRNLMITVPIRKQKTYLILSNVTWSWWVSQTSPNNSIKIGSFWVGTLKISFVIKSFFLIKLLKYLKRNWWSFTSLNWPNFEMKNHFSLLICILPTVSKKS